MLSQLRFESGTRREGDQKERCEWMGTKSEGEGQGQIQNQAESGRLTLKCIRTLLQMGWKKGLGKMEKNLIERDKLNKFTLGSLHFFFFFSLMGGSETEFIDK